MAVNTCGVCGKPFQRLDRHMATHVRAFAAPAAPSGRAAPPAPADLGPAGVALWAAVTGGYRVAAHLLPVLLAACRETARAEQAEADVARDGTYDADRYGARKPHPGIAVARSSRLAAARLLRQLDLAPPPAEGAAPPLLEDFTRPA